MSAVRVALATGVGPGLGAALVGRISVRMEKNSSNDPARRRLPKCLA